MTTDIVPQMDGKFTLLDTKGDNELAIDIYEKSAISAASIARDARSVFAYNLHMILEYELWKHRLDHDGMPFARQQDYLQYLSQEAQVGISTMKGYHTAIRLARNLGYDSMQEIDDRGLDVFKEVSRRLKLDRQTAEPLELKRGRLPAGANIREYVSGIIVELGNSQGQSDTNLTPFDRHLEMQRLLEPGAPRVWFEYQRGEVLWFYERYEDGNLDFQTGKLTITMSNEPPGVVFSELMNKLGVDID